MLARTRLPHSLLPLLLLALAAAPLHADGVPLGPSPGEAQLRPAVVPDGKGGAFVTYKTATARVGAVHVNGAGVADGGPGFDPVPVPFTLESGEPLRFVLSSDSEVVIASDRAAAAGPALTRLRPGGVAQPGFPVGLGAPYQHPALVAGLGGRTLIVAKGSDATSYWTVRAAVVAADGQVESAVELSSQLQFFNVDRLDAATDGAGGLIAIMPYYDALNTGSKDLCAFRLAADGSRPWGELPRPIVMVPRDQTDPHVVPDGVGGVMAVWSDPRSAGRSTDIYALRLDQNMNRPPGWLFYGQAVCDASGEQTQPRLVRDGGTGVWVVWLDQRNGTDGDLRYSRMLWNGELGPGLTRAGAVLCEAPGAQSEAEIAPDGAGGFYAVWRDERSGDADLYVQHVLGSGLVAPGWPAHGRPLVEAPGVQDQPALAALPGGRVVIAWRDARDGIARIYSTAMDDPANADSDLPGVAGLALAAADPVRGALHATISLPAAAPAVLELMDVTGRLRARTRLAGPLREASVTLRPSEPLEPGLFFLRLRQGHSCASVRVSVLR